MATGLFFVAMLLGPSVSGLILTALLEGRSGLRQLGSGLLRWRVGVGWYAAALLTAPLMLLAILWSFSALVAPTFAPHFQWTLLAVGLIAGVFEEIGWTGFATPLLLARRGVGAAGLLLGLVWAVWHGLVVFLFTFGAMGAAWIWSFAIVYIATLTPFRILMTWVYANTKSVLLAVLMHASYTGWLLAVFPATSPAQSLIWQAVFAAFLWLAAAAALRNSARKANRRPLAAKPLQRHEATR
jgi:membrane protease YdiL (CAAX protease family)